MPDLIVVGFHGTHRAAEVLNQVLDLKAAAVGGSAVTLGATGAMIGSTDASNDKTKHGITSAR